MNDAAKDWIFFKIARCGREFFKYCSIGRQIMYGCEKQDLTVYHFMRRKTDASVSFLPGGQPG